MNKNYYEGIPVVPLRGLVVFPYTYVSFDVGRDMSVAAIEAASNNGGTIFLVAQKDQKLSEITKDNLFSTGCVCRIKNIVKLPGETIQVTVCGLFRAVVDGFSQEEPFFAANVIAYDDEKMNSDEAEAMRPIISKKFREYLKAAARPGMAEAFNAIEKTIESYAYLFRIANIALLKFEERQQFIEQDEYISRCMMLLNIIERELDLANLSKRIEQSVKEQVDKNQKDYILREQIRAIRKELGETEQQEADEFRSRLSSRDFPPEIKAKLEKEIERFAMLPPGSHEMPSMRTYIDCLLDLPYTEESEDNLDIVNARAILDADHYGLEKVKDRIIEYLAVAKKGKSRLVIEIKTHKDLYQLHQCIDKTIEAVKKFKMQKDVDYIAFSYAAVLRIIEKTPKGTPVYYLNGDMEPQKLKEIGCAGPDYEQTVFLKKHPEWIKQCQDLGMKVNVWTVDNEDNMKALIEHGVDFITTNEPEVLQKLLK